MCRKAALSIFVLIIFLGLIYVVRVYRTPSKVFDPITFAQSYDFQQPTPNPINPDPLPLPLKQTAWFPDWDSKKSIAVFRQVADKLDSISPVWYYYEENGVRESKKGLEETLAVAKEHHVKVIPTITSFDRDHVHEIFKDEASVRAHAQYILGEIEKYGFDGFDIDYESIHFPDQKAYFSLLQQLYTELDQKGKVLSVAVVPKWSDQLVTGSLAETRKVQDWYELSEFTHEIRIMAYEATTPNNTYPGPIAPLPWVEAILKYAITRIPREKIMLGIHLYGYDGWNTKPENITPYLGGAINTIEPKLQATPITFENLSTRLPKLKSKILDPVTKEQVLIYTDKDTDRIVYYQDAESTKYRIDLAKQYGIAGVAYWRMGGEDIGVYDLTK